MTSSVRGPLPGEITRFERLNPTYHRGHDPVLIVTDQAIYREGSGRSTLRIHHAEGVLEWSTPFDSYSREKLADRKLLLDFMDAARLAGAKVDRP